ncbi:MAG: hypothetical protein WB816_16615 [Methylocystis sp.]
MAKFRPLGYLGYDDISGVLLRSDLWRSVDSVEQLFNTALPNLKCPICANDVFTLVRNFDEKSSPQMDSYRWGESDAVEFTPTIAIHCDDCGHFLLFAEEKLLARAERKK